jgi:HSP20 family molecular chaperone IbpA/uncharacterized membrane protein
MSMYFLHVGENRSHCEAIMERFESSIEVDCPLRTVYNQWTQFEEFPRFMEGVEQVRQLDETHLYWRATVGGKTKEWNAEITEQVPDQRIAWKSTSGAPNAGSVHFEPVGADRTRVTVKLAYDPQGITENIGDALGVVSRRIERTLHDFKAFVEGRGRESGAWRGEVHQGRAEGGAASGARSAATASEGFREEARAGTGSSRSRSAEDARREAFPRGRAGRGRLEVLEEPFGLIRRMWSDMDRAFGRGGWPFRFGGSNESALWSPHVEVTQRGDELLVTADLPGVKREDVTLDIDDNALILQGERRSERRSEEQGMFRSECEYGSFYRAIPLPESTDPASAQASMENGVLKITLRAPPARRQGHRVDIQGN